MQIFLGEDDGFLFAGVPRNIVVTVITDDGKKTKFPYDAKKSMARLYKDVRDFIHESNYSEHKEEIPKPYIPARDPSLDKHLVVSDGNKIEREDIVSCIHLEKRESSCDLKVGGQYRVLKAFRKDLPDANGKMHTIYDGYDVIDDSSASPIRTFVFPHEVVLLRKRSPAPQKTSNFEQIVSCAECGEPSALVLDKEKDKYIGECFKCHKPMEAERAKSSDKTA